MHDLNDLLTARGSIALVERTVRANEVGQTPASLKSDLLLWHGRDEQVLCYLDLDQVDALKAGDIMVLFPAFGKTAGLVDPRERSRPTRPSPFQYDPRWCENHAGQSHRSPPQPPSIPIVCRELATPSEPPIRLRSWSAPTQPAPDLPNRSFDGETASRCLWRRTYS